MIDRKSKCFSTFKNLPHDNRFAETGCYTLAVESWFRRKSIVYFSTYDVTVLSFCSTQPNSRSKNSKDFN